MNFDLERKQVEDILAPYLSRKELELFELKLRHSGKTLVIDIVVDKKTGGILVDECADVNRFLDKKIEEESLWEDYTIEVCSPGLDRPLKETKDFLRVIGKEIQVYLGEPIEDRIQFDGVLKDANDEKIFLLYKEGVIEIPFNKINKGLQVI